MITIVSRWSAIFALILLGLAGPVAAQPGTPAPSPAQTVQAPLVSDPDYSIGVGDVVDLVVVGSPEYSTRARISNDGTILLPLIGPIKALGLTPATLAESIGAALKSGGYFANPVVRVELVGIQSRYVTVLGHVGNPGLIPLDRPYRLSEILARIGGKGAGGANYIIVTPANGPSKRYTIESLATGGPDEDPVAQAGDKIYIPSAENDVYYLNGEVKTPGSFPLEGELTVQIALAKAGGLTENGSAKRVTVVRKGRTLKGVKLDSKIEPGDVVTVGGRLF